MRIRSNIGLFALALATANCRSCKNDHPYVPYSIGDGSPEDAAVALPSNDEEDAGAFVEQPAERAPENANQWTISGVSVSAEPGFVFDWGIAKDLDGDGRVDVVAIEHSAEITGDEGKLVFYKSTPQGLSAPRFPIANDSLDRRPNCTYIHRLGAVGHHTVIVETTSACNDGSSGLPVTSSSEPDRRIQVIAFTNTGVRIHFSASVVDPVNAPSLFFDFDAADRDGDGIEDIAVRVSIEGGGAPFEPLRRASVIMRWFDRPAGMSRDDSEPDTSLRVLASTAATLAAKSKDAPTVPSSVRAIRSLYGALCREGGAPRLVKILGNSALSCGASHALEEAGLAEVRAYTVMGDSFLAANALAHAQSPPATKSANRSKDAETWLLQSSPLATAQTVRVAAAVPLFERGSEPSWGALAFDNNNKLLVRTAAGVVRMDPESGDESDARDVAPWGMAVVSPDNNFRFTETYNPCDARSDAVLHAILARTEQSSALTQDVKLPLLPPLGPRCSGTKFESRSGRGQTIGDAVAALPIAWGAGGLEAIVDGFPVLITEEGRATLLQSPMNQPYSLGSARSPDGHTMVIPSVLGLLVRGSKSRTLRAVELDGTYGELRDCAVNNDGTRAACVRAGHAWVGIWP